MQGSRVSQCRKFEAADQSRQCGGSGDRGCAAPRHKPGHESGGDAAHRTGGTQRRRHSRIRPVQQPAGQQGGGHVSRCHGRRGVVPCVPVTDGRVNAVARSVRPMTGLGEGRGSHPGQGDMKPALGDEGARKNTGQGKPAACGGPDENELHQRERAHQAPRHRPFHDRVVSQGSEHTADEGEQAGTDACTGTTRPQVRAPVVIPRHMASRHGSSSSSPSLPAVTRSCGSPPPAAPVCGWRGRRTGWGPPGRRPRRGPRWR